MSTGERAKYLPKGVESTRRARLVLTVSWVGDGPLPLESHRILYISIGALFGLRSLSIVL